VVDESNIDLLRFLKALADETRLKMAALLASKATASPVNPPRTIPPSPSAMSSSLVSI